jgi:hypothetical protein
MPVIMPVIIPVPIPVSVVVSPPVAIPVSVVVSPPVAIPVSVVVSPPVSTAAPVWVLVSVVVSTPVKTELLPAAPELPTPPPVSEDPEVTPFELEFSSAPFDDEPPHAIVVANASETQIGLLSFLISTPFFSYDVRQGPSFESCV